AREQPRDRDEPEGYVDEEQVPPGAQQQMPFTRCETDQAPDPLSYRLQSVVVPLARGPAPGGPRRLAAPRRRTRRRARRRSRAASVRRRGAARSECPLRRDRNRRRETARGGQPLQSTPGTACAR